MATDDRISVLLNQQFPDFVKEEGPLFIEFVKAYYEWMEQEGYAIDVSKNLLNYQDVDAAPEKYFEFLKNEVLASIPDEIRSNKRLFAKHAKELYRARGSEQSYRFLFRALFGEEINFFYPADVMLRVSDGRWVQEQTIRIGPPFTGNVIDLVGHIVEGETSGAQARVDYIITICEFGLEIYELYLVNIEGTFVNNERVFDFNGEIGAGGFVYGLSGPLSKVNVTSGGAFHSFGDVVTLEGRQDGTSATGVVTRTSDTSAVEFYIVDGGFGYTVGNNDIEVFGGSGRDADWEVTGISNVVSYGYFIDRIHSFRNVVLSTDPRFDSAGTIDTSLYTPSANLESANINSSLVSALGTVNTNIGVISSIQTTNYGYGYSTLPGTTVQNIELRDARILANTVSGAPAGTTGILGTNAVILSRNVRGAIVEVNITSLGTAYRRNEIVDIVNQTSIGTIDAFGTAEVTGFVQYPGRYTDTKGWVSWGNFLQDNLYYQEFSYVIVAEESIQEYRKFVYDLVHPGGTKLFNRYLLIGNADFTNTTIDGSAGAGQRITKELDLNTQYQALDDTVCLDLSIDIDANLEVNLFPGQFSNNPLDLGAANTEASLVANLVITVYVDGTGTIYSNTNNTLTSYEDEQLNTYDPAPVDHLGTYRLLWGNNTTAFANDVPEIRNPTAINVRNGPTVNGYFRTEKTYSNNYLLLSEPVTNTSGSSTIVSAGTYRHPQVTV